MANRRMFSNRIANSAKFLQMPIESQLLYFHMVLRADDDGIVESYPIMRLLGFAPDNFKVLTAKGFIKQLNEDQVVVILDWLEHNVIRADRKVNSVYLPLLKSIIPEINVIEPKERSDVEDNSKRIGGQSTVGISKVKLSKVNTTVANATEWSFLEELEKLKNSNRKDYKIIALYWKKKGWTFQNKEQYNPAFKRELKAAKDLKGYTGEQIAKSIVYCEREYPDIWTLETVHKRIAQLVLKPKI